MELRVISSEPTEMEIEIGGEDHTFMNVLKQALLDLDGVQTATYDVNPEQSGGQTDPILTVKTTADLEPLEAISEATVQIQDQIAEFRDTFSAAA